VQRGKLPIVDSADFVIITMGHAKMSSLRHAAGNTHVEVNAGGSAVIARAVEAAMNPTEGQRMLQAGFQGAILGGVSREKTSISCDIDGMERVDRLVERSVVSENGQQVLVQQVQQSAAQQLLRMPDIEMATKADLEAVKSNSITKIHFDTTISTNISTISALISDSMKGVVEIVKTTNVNIAVVQTLVGDMREETDKKIKGMQKKMKAKNAERDAKDAERDAKDEQRDAKDKERDDLIASLQRDRCKEKKRPADDQGEGGIEKKQASAWSKVVTNIYKKNGSNIFRWQKTTKGIKHSEKDHKTFKTVEEASKAMAVYFKNEAK
jgi:hypothetical protein